MKLQPQIEENNRKISTLDHSIQVQMSKVDNLQKKVDGYDKSKKTESTSQNSDKNEKK